MASPHLAAPSASSNAGVSPITSPTNSHSTTATFGPGSGTRPQPHNASSTGNTPSSQPPSGNLFQQRGQANAAINASPNTPLSTSNSTNAHVIDGPRGRILCVADIRGNISSLNNLAAETNAQAIIHTGDFGFFESESFERISDRTLRHLVQYSTLIPAGLRTKLLVADAPGGGRNVQGQAGVSAASLPPPQTPCKEMRAQMLAHPDTPLLTDFPKLLSGQLRLNVPVYTVWGACEDVRILEKLRTREHVIDNLHVLDEASTVAIEVGGVRLRLFGLGGAVVLHKLFDNGEGAATIAGGQGTMWTTILQIGELIDTAQRCYDPSETRLLVTHASPGREGLLMQLALALKADLTISAGLHFRYGVSYNEFSVQSDTEQFRRKLLQSKSAFGEVWDSVRQQVEDVVDDQQRILLNNGLAVTNRVPNAATATGAVHEEPAWKNTWNWNLPDAAFGHLVLDICEGRVSSEIKSQGFNFAYRRTEANSAAATTPAATVAGNAPTAAAASQSTAMAGIPSGPAKMRQQQEHGQPPRGPLPPKNPRQHRSPNVSSHSGTAAEGRSEHGSRPTSRGSRHERGGYRSSGDEAGSRGSRNSAAVAANANGTSGERTSTAAAKNEATTANGAAAQPKESGSGNVAIPASSSQQPSKPLNSGSGGRGHRSKKSGASSRSEKSGSESESKHSAIPTGAATAATPTTTVPSSTTAATAGEGGETGQSGAPRGGGRGGRGAGSGGRGGGRGGRGRGGGGRGTSEGKPAAQSQSGGGEGGKAGAS